MNFWIFKDKEEEEHINSLKEKLFVIPKADPTKEEIIEKCPQKMGSSIYFAECIKCEFYKEWDDDTMISCYHPARERYR